MNKIMSQEELRKALKKDPKDAEVNRLLGASYLRQGNHKEAVKFFRLSAMFSPAMVSKSVIDFEDFLLNDPGNVGARLSLVDFLLSQGDLESAIIELEELVEISPETAQVYNVLGRIYLKLGRIDGAISLLEKAKESGRGDTSLLESLAGAYIEKERYADAILMYEELLRSDPMSKRVLRTLSELYGRVNNYDCAADKWSQMLSSDPDSLSETTSKLEELSRMSPNSPQILEQLSRAYMLSLKPDLAVLQLGRIMQLSPERIDSVVSALRRLLQTYPDDREAMFLLAECLIKKSSYSEAVEIYDKLLLTYPDLLGKCMDGLLAVIKEYPDQVGARQSLADCYLAKGNTSKALEQYRHVVRLNPSETEQIEKKCREILRADPKMSGALVVMAEAFLSNKEYRKAIAVAEDLVAQGIKTAPVYTVLGEAYLNIDMLTRSKESYQSALALEPYDEMIQKKYRQICDKDLEKEIQTVRAKIEQDPWRAGLNLDLARLYHKKGSLDAALRALQNAVRDSSRAPYSHSLMGTIFKEQGRFDLAQAQFEKVLEFRSTEDHGVEKAARAGLAGCLEAQGKIKEAVSMYESVLSIDIDFPGAKEKIHYLNQANTSSVRNKAAALVLESPESQAVKAAWGRDARRQKGSDEEDLTLMSFGQEHNSQGFDELMKGRTKTAEEGFVLAAQLDSTHLPAANNLAVIHLMNGDVEKAFSGFARAALEDSGNAVYHNNLAVLHILKKDLQKAEKEIKLALKADKELGAALINNADIEMLKGSTKAAAQGYRKIALLDPFYELAARRTQYWAV